MSQRTCTRISVATARRLRGAFAQGESVQCEVLVARLAGMGISRAQAYHAVRNGAQVGLLRVARRNFSRAVYVLADDWEGPLRRDPSPRAGPDASPAPRWPACGRGPLVASLGVACADPEAPPPDIAAAIDATRRRLFEDAAGVE